MTEKSARFRSPPYPYIGLGKAIERAKLLFLKARHFAVPLVTAAGAWGIKITSSATLQTAAALLQYGLIEDAGSKDQRTVKLSKLGLAITMDERPNSADRDNNIKKAALSPTIFDEIWQRFGSTEGLDDSIVIHFLTLERQQEGKSPYSADAAREVLRVYRESVEFAKLDDRSRNSVGFADTRSSNADLTPQAPTVSVGDLIQWVSGGELKLPEPAIVRFVEPSGKWVFIKGSETGIPIEQVEVVTKGPEDIPSPPAPKLPLEPAITQDEAPKVSPQSDSVRFTIDGNRVLIIASVDLSGLRKLKKKLESIELLLSEEN